ncbi:hypothetical protein DRW48_05345 [Paracoccus suum]|uniref:Flagellar protein FlgJ N-terminal domain-containing protein n=1 Tax=Paracoccus suum TaxID=2259340 RepID=A0A344PII0_9RHOB|nr:hypothetical protein DRW48_05345 [Paracoccus suum]
MSVQSGRPLAPANVQRSPADRLEAAFLEEMMKYIGPKAREGANSGGAGEAQFHSFLTRGYADLMADRIDLKLFAGAPSEHAS